MKHDSIVLNILGSMTGFWVMVLNSLERALGGYYANSSVIGLLRALASSVSSGFRRAGSCSIALFVTLSSLVLLKVLIFNFAGTVYYGSEVMNALGRAAENSRWLR
jgi:predicted membrane channel-forming protein YqfA (hemolysin III family)